VQNVRGIAFLVLAGRRRSSSSSSGTDTRLVGRRGTDIVLSVVFCTRRIVF
jgi:hypothetical protein